MIGFSVLMFVFGIMLIIAGLYIFTGHKDSVLLWKVYDKNISKEQLRVLGKWTMLSAILPMILAVIGLFLHD